MNEWIIHALTAPIWVGGATWGAGAMTAIGLALTYRQAAKARGAAEAVRDATVRTVKALNRKDHLAELGEAAQLALRIKDRAAAGDPQAVRTGLEVLRAKIDSLEATADRDHSTNREARALDRILGMLERHADAAVAVSTPVVLEATLISHHLNDVRGILSRRAQRLKRAVPEDADVQPG